MKGGTPPVPPLPTAPLHDTQAVLASDTITARAEQNEQQIMQDAQAGKLGSPSKDNPPPIPPPLVTAGPNAIALPIAGTDVPSEYAGWSSKYRITNEWYGVVGANGATVDAGSKADDIIRGIWNTPEQGVLIVTTETGDWTQNEYLTPQRTGPLTITSYNGACISLTSTGGTTYLFDVATLSWSCGGPTP